MTRPTESTVAHLLAAIPEEKRDKLFKLMKDGPAAVEELTGHRPHKGALYRWAAKGVVGVNLETVSVGRTRFTSRRMLLTFFAETEAARRAKNEPQPAPPRRSRGTTRRATSRYANMTDAEVEAVLERHGLGRKQQGRQK